MLRIVQDQQISASHSRRKKLDAKNVDARQVSRLRREIFRRRPLSAVVYLYKTLVGDCQSNIRHLSSSSNISSPVYPITIRQMVCAFYSFALRVTLEARDITARCLRIACIQFVFNAPVYVRLWTDEWRVAVLLVLPTRFTNLNVH